MATFFVSYSRQDLAWAEWIAWQLEEAGHGVTIQAWDFAAGNDFVRNMHEALARDRIVAVLSSSYLASSFAASEWTSAFAQDPTGRDGKLVVARIERVSPTGLLAARSYIDLFDLNADAARDRLLTAIQPGRGKPFVEPRFPGGSTAMAHPSFPGASTTPAARLEHFDTRATLHASMSARGLFEHIVWEPTSNLATYPAAMQVAGFSAKGRTDLSAPVSLYHGESVNISFRVDVVGFGLSFYQGLYPTIVLIEPQRGAGQIVFGNVWRPQEAFVGVFSDEPLGTVRIQTQACGSFLMGTFSFYSRARY